MRLFVYNKRNRQRKDKIMEEQDRSKKLAPPYLSWRTFIGFVKSFDQGLPPRIDKSAMIRLSGGNQNLMTNALIYLKLTNSEGRPEKLLEQIVDATSPEKQAEYKEHLKTMLKGAYTFLFDGVGDFDLERSTSASFDEKFRAEGVSGDTVQKCEAFFIAAAQEAGIKISRLILEAKRKGPKRASPSGSSRPKFTKPDGKPQEEKETLPPPEKPKPSIEELPAWYSTFKPAFNKLPDFNKAHWTSAEREKWIVLVTALVDAYVEVDDGKKK
jgi:hypothetical protein